MLATTSSICARAAAIVAAPVILYEVLAQQNIHSILSHASKTSMTYMDFCALRARWPALFFRVDPEYTVVGQNVVTPTGTVRYTKRYKLGSHGYEDSMRLWPIFPPISSLWVPGREAPRDTQ